MKRIVIFDTRHIWLILLVLIPFFITSGGSDYEDKAVPVPTPASRRLDYRDHALQVQDTNTARESVTIPARFAPFFFDKMNINRADNKLLQIIPGVGPELAAKIIAKRDERGGFTDSSQLQLVNGIGPKRQNHLEKWLGFE